MKQAKNIQKILLRRACRKAGLGPPETEYVFHPTRKWRFDFAWPSIKLAVEYEGGKPGFHNSHGKWYGQRRDLEKYNEAIVEGWVVFRYGMHQAGMAYMQIREYLNRRATSG